LACRYRLPSDSPRFCCCPEGARPGFDPLSLHDALPIYCQIDFPAKNADSFAHAGDSCCCRAIEGSASDEHKPCSQRQGYQNVSRSEEHTSELQSLRHLVCRLLLEKTNSTN